MSCGRCCTTRGTKIEQRFEPQTSKTKIFPFFILILCKLGLIHGRVFLPLPPSSLNCSPPNLLYFLFIPQCSFCPPPSSPRPCLSPFFHFNVVFLRLAVVFLLLPSVPTLLALALISFFLFSLAPSMMRNLHFFWRGAVNHHKRGG